jgi:hypothetical protein
MAIDVRSLGEWLRAAFGRGRLSGGGPVGTASLQLAATRSCPDPRSNDDAVAGEATERGARPLP